MKTNKGIHCNEQSYTDKTKRDRIVFRFVTDDLNTPSKCTVRLGDTDPLTGEKFTDETILEEYYKLANHQVYVNKKETKDRLSLDAMVNDESDSELENKASFCVPFVDPFADLFAEDDPDDIIALREFAASLKGLQADIYEAMLAKYAEGKVKITLKELSDKWDISIVKIFRYRKKMIRIIEEKIRQSRELDY